jgi:hypothetical protein
MPWPTRRNRSACRLERAKVHGCGTRRRRGTRPLWYESFRNGRTRHWVIGGVPGSLVGEQKRAGLPQEAPSMTVRGLNRVLG